MTYEHFKTQLYYSLLELRDTERTELGILEKGTEYGDPTAQRVICAVNCGKPGPMRRTLQEDILYAIWDENRYDSMFYWWVRQYYERYLAEGWQAVLPELAAAINREGEGTGGLPAENDTYLQHRGSLILRPVSYVLRREELVDSIFWQLGDIALVLYLLVYDDPDNLLSLKLGRNFTERWKKRDSVLLTGALLNCVAKMPPRLYPGQDMLSFYDDQGGVFMRGKRGCARS